MDKYSLYYKKNLYALQDKVRKSLPEDIQRQTLYLERLREDIATVKAKHSTDPERFFISVMGKVYTDRKEGGLALMNALHASKPETVVAEYAGLKISMNPLVTLMEVSRSVTLSGVGKYNMDIGESASGLLTRLDNFCKEFPSREERAENRLNQLKHDLVVAEEEIKKPFEHAERLAELLKEQAELNAELDVGKREEIVMDEGKEETVAVNSDDEAAMRMPERKVVQTAHKKKMRRTLGESNAKLYRKKQSENADSYVFIGNGNAYEIYGDRAIELAERYELPLITDTLSGDEQKVLSVDIATLDKVVSGIDDDGHKAVIIEPLEEIKEDTFIDNEDKIAAMEVAVLPDYTVSQEDMHDAGYMWDGMLPLRKRTAKVLVGLGLPVVALKGDDTERKVTTTDEVERGGNLFGIEKPDWNEFISSDKGRAYLYARLLLCQATSREVNEEMSYFDAQFVDGLSDNNFAERAALEKCLRETEKPDTEQIKPYMKVLLEDYTVRFSGIPLSEYGWELHNVRDDLAKFIPDEEISKYAQELAYEKKLHDEIDARLEQIVWLNGKTEGFDKDDIPDIVNDLKPDFENSYFNKSGEGEYDEWYDEFAEETLTPYLKSKAVESSSENTSLEERVKASVEAEYQVFYAEQLKKTPEELINNNYKIRFFNEMSVFLGEEIKDNLYARDLQALLTDSPQILENLYDYYLGNEYASINNYSDDADLVMAYNDKYHEEIVADRYSWNEGDFDGNEALYYGKDTGNTAFYYLPSLSYGTLPEIKEKADSYVIFCKNSLLKYSCAWNNCSAMQATIVSFAL